jgi:uncharacterized cupredoxin-like copper-binding protein
VRTRRVLVTLVALIAAGALGSSSPRAETTTSAVGVWLKEWRVIPSRKVVPAGKVTFVVANIGKIEHELVVVRSSRAPDALPIRGKKAGEAGSRGEVEELRPPHADRLTLRLSPGKYVLLCNLADHGGHYKHGMFARLTVR